MFSATMNQSVRNAFYRMSCASKIHGDDGAPDEGAISICLNCGQLLIFDAQLKLRAGYTKAYE